MRKLTIIFIQTSCIAVVLTILIFLLIYKMGNKNCLQNNSDEKDLRRSNASFLHNRDDYNIVVLNPEFIGQDNNGQKYKLLASVAAKDFRGLYKIQEVCGNYSDFLIITAKSGVIDEKNKYALLNDKVRVKYYDYLIESTNVFVNLANGEVYNNQGIIMNYNNSSIKAGSFKATRNSIMLNGNVTASFKISSL